MSDLQDLFDEVVALIRDTPVTTDLAVSNEDKLRMYGLYKQATAGSCPVETVPPPMWQPRSRAKYESWVSYRQVDSAEAMLNYVRVAARQNHWLGHKCFDLLKK
jgi:acyl-CoA-binding protein